VKTHPTVHIDIMLQQQRRVMNATFQTCPGMRMKIAAPGQAVAGTFRLFREVLAPSA
jgi:hypothetical protein